MQTNLVHVTTSDDVLLSGAYFAPSCTSSSSIDAVVFLHGDGSHFYAPLYLRLGESLAAVGVGCLCGNRRGHDLVAHGPGDRSLAGYAFESVNDSRADLRAWLNRLVEFGHQRVALGGHSGGAVRVVYAQAVEHYPEVAAVVAVSPGEYHHRSVISCHGDAFVDPFERAERQVSAGEPDTLSVPGVPWGSMWSAKTYVDCFNPDDRYSVSAHAVTTSCPTLFVFGAEECEGPEILPVCSKACERVRALDSAHVQVQVISGANHGYENREEVLFGSIKTWLATL